MKRIIFLTKINNIQSRLQIPSLVYTYSMSMREEVKMMDSQRIINSYTYSVFIFSANKGHTNELLLLN